MLALSFLGLSLPVEEKVCFLMVPQVIQGSEETRACAHQGFLNQKHHYWTDLGATGGAEVNPQAICEVLFEEFTQIGSQEVRLGYNRWSLIKSIIFYEKIKYIY